MSCKNKKIKIFEKNLKNPLHLRGVSFIITHVVTLIAMKREVAALIAGFPWSECQVKKLATSHCIHVKYVHQKCGNRVKVRRTHTGKCTVTACRTRKVRKGGDFFYGKSSNENYSESL